MRRKKYYPCCFFFPRFPTWNIPPKLMETKNFPYHARVLCVRARYQMHDFSSATCFDPSRCLLRITQSRTSSQSSLVQKERKQVNVKVCPSLQQGKDHEGRWVGGEGNAIWSSSPVHPPHAHKIQGFGIFRRPLFFSFCSCLFVCLLVTLFVCFYCFFAL